MHIGENLGSITDVLNTIGGVVGGVIHAAEVGASVYNPTSSPVYNPNTGAYACGPGAVMDPQTGLCVRDPNSMTQSQIPLGLLVLGAFLLMRRR